MRKARERARFIARMSRLVVIFHFGKRTYAPVRAALLPHDSVVAQLAVNDIRENGEAHVRLDAPFTFSESAVDCVVNALLGNFVGSRSQGKSASEIADIYKLCTALGIDYQKFVVPHFFVLRESHQAQVACSQQALERRQETTYPGWP